MVNQGILDKLFHRHPEPEPVELTPEDKDLQELLHDFVMDHDCEKLLPSGMRFYTVTIQEGSPIWRALDLHAQKEKTHADI